MKKVLAITAKSVLIAANAMLVCKVIRQNKRIKAISSMAYEEGYRNGCEDIYEEAYKDGANDLLDKINNLGLDD